MGRAGSSFLASGWGNKGRRLRFSESRSLEEWSCGAGVPICQRDLCSSAAATSEGPRRLDGSPGQSWLPEPAAVPGSTPMRAAAIQEGAAFLPSSHLLDPCVSVPCVSAGKRRRCFQSPSTSVKQTVEEWYGGRDSLLLKGKRLTWCPGGLTACPTRLASTAPQGARRAMRL